MSKILVTGGCGFIGSNFINYWLKNHPDDFIINLDKMTYAADENYIDKKLVRNNYKLIKGDICDKELVLSITKDVDTVINFAAETHVDNSIADPSAFIKSNYEGVFNLLEATRKYNLRFHQVSTDEVYGSLPLNSKERFNENSCYNPRNPYSATKAAADFLVKSYFNTYKIKATISNCSNNFGPNQHTEKLIPKTIINALSGKEIPVYGEGNQIRDWIYVEDHVRALELILEKGKYGETYLVSAENEVRNIDLVRNILKILNKGVELIKFTNDRPGHDVRYSLDPSKLKNELGWKPANSFNESLKFTVSHYSETYTSSIP
ncbi:MAG: dTDP-glucose 4,6-dehydratase [Candidatus Parvarchaeota archaeon]